MLLKAMQSHSQIIHNVDNSSDIDEAIVKIEKEDTSVYMCPPTDCWTLLDPRLACS